MSAAALLSLGLHIAAIGLLIAWMRWHVPVVVTPLDQPATVQLVMSPPGGETRPTTTSPETPPPAEPSKQATAAPASPSAPPTPETAPAPAAIPRPQTPAPTAEAATAAPSPPTPAAEATTAAASPPAPPSDHDKLTFDFASVESDTNALVTGDLLVPPSPDIKFHNRKPSYPNAAVMLGEHGSVILLIHVSSLGLVSGADVVHSSGYPMLDHAALDAVLTWHFLPSIKDGQPVPSDFPMQFVFTPD